MMAGRILHHGLDDLDAADLRRRAPRAFTQDLSRYIFEHGADADGVSLVGVRYLSRLGDDIENWAIFEGTEPSDTTSAPATGDDVDLAAALTKLDLTLGG